MLFGANPLSLWILCYWCVLGLSKTVSDKTEDEKFTDIPVRQKRTVDGGQLPPLPITRQSSSVPTGRSGQASHDYQHGGASYVTSGTEQTNTRRDPGDDEIRTRMVFNTANYDVIAETGRSTYTPNTRASTGVTNTAVGPDTNTGGNSRTTVTQYYVTREGTAQRLGTNDERGTGNENTDSTRYNSGVQVQYPDDSRTQTGGHDTQTSHSQTNQRHGQTTRERLGRGQTNQGQTTSYNYNTGTRTYPGRRQNPLHNTGTQTSRTRSNTPVYTTGADTRTRSNTPVYTTGADTRTRSNTPVYTTGAGTQTYHNQYPTDTGTTYTTDTRTTQTQTQYPYQTGTTYTTGTQRVGGYNSLGQVFNINNNPRQTTNNNRRVSNRGRYTSGTSSVPNTGIISDDPNCPTSTYRVYINNMECTRAVDTLGSFICYNYERVSRDCCEKCLSIKRSSNTGCEYGDRSYQCRNMEPFDCYAPRNREICCDTCSRYESQRNTGISGCQYGDLTPRCQIVSERRHLCYLPENQRLCCLTCPRLEDSSNPTCKWGDQNPQLCEPFTEDNQLRVNCYQTSVRQVCCSTCERLRSRIRVNIPGCQFGDRPVRMNTPLGMLACREYVRQYGVEVCETEAINTHCCHTCYQYRALSRG